MSEPRMLKIAELEEPNRDFGFTLLIRVKFGLIRKGGVQITAACNQ